MSAFFSKYKKHILTALISVVFFSYIFLWYKQFTYFNYSSMEESLFDEVAIKNASTAAEKDFELDGRYAARLNRIIFWATEYSDIYIDNGSGDTIQVTVSDYYGGDVPAMPEPVILSPGQSCSFVSDGRSGFVMTVYGEHEGQAVEGIRLSHDNARYMDCWKKAALCMLGLVAGISAISLVCMLFVRRAYTKVAPYVFLVLGALCLILMVLLKYMGNEDWTYIPLQMLAAYFSVMAFLGGTESDPAMLLYEKRERSMYPAFWGVVSIIIALVLQFLLLTSRRESVLYAFNGGLDAKRRIMGYVIVVLVFVISYLVLGRIKPPDRLSDYIRSCFSGRTALMSVLLFLLAVGEAWITENPFRAAVAAILVVLAGLWGRLKLKKVFFALYTAAVVLLAALNSCIINFWDTGAWADVYHTSAFYNSLLPVAINSPFDDGMNQMYGHYAFFYKVPMLVFGNNMCTVGLTTGFFAAVSVLAAMLSMKKLLKNDFSALLIGAVLMVSTITERLYPMTFPLRMTWSFLLLLYCVYTKGTARKLLWKLGGYLICVLSIVWNPESGAVCLICFWIYTVIREQESVDLKKSMVLLIKELVFVIMAVLSAYTLIKGYNIMTDPGAGFLREFLDWKKEFGLVAKYESGDTSDGRLYWSNAPWIYIEIALFALSLVLIKRLGVFTGEKYKTNDTGKALLLVFSVGIFSYWMYRPEEYDIIMPYIGCLLVMVYDRYISEAKECKINNLVRLWAGGNVLKTVVPICISFGIACYIIAIPQALVYTKTNIIEGQILNYVKVCSYMREFDENVPQDAYLEALGVSMISMSTGRKLEGNPRAESSEEMLRDNTADKEWVILGTDNPGLEDFELYKEIAFGKYTYYLYHNKAFR